MAKKPATAKKQVGKKARKERLKKAEYKQRLIAWQKEKKIAIIGFVCAMLLYSFGFVYWLAAESTYSDKNTIEKTGIVSDIREVEMFLFVPDMASTMVVPIGGGLRCYITFDDGEMYWCNNRYLFRTTGESFSNLCNQLIGQQVTIRTPAKIAKTRIVTLTIDDTPILTYENANDYSKIGKVLSIICYSVVVGLHSTILWGICTNKPLENND